jgi:DNA repair protein RadC
MVRLRTRHLLVDDVPVRAGQLLRIEVLDHVIVTPSRHSSLRELGWFHP